MVVKECERRNQEVLVDLSELWGPEMAFGTSWLFNISWLFSLSLMSLFYLALVPLFCSLTFCLVELAWLHCDPLGAWHGSCLFGIEIMELVLAYAPLQAWSPEIPP